VRLGVNGRFYAAPETGVQRFAREVTARLCETEQVVLFLPRAAKAPPRVIERSQVVRGRLNGPAWEQLELPHRARHERCTVVLNAANAAPTRGGPHVIMLQDVTPLTNPEWYTRRFVLWFRYGVRRAARHAAKVLVPSAWTKEQVLQAVRVPEDMVSIVTQGIEPFDTPAPPDAVARARTLHGLPARYLLALGGTNPRKNLSFLLEVLARWPRDAGDPPALVVVGDALPWVHRAHPGMNGADVRVVPRAPDDELRALYTGAEALCFPSLAEGFGRPPLEAMGCSTPVVAAEYGAAREVLGDAAQILPLDAEAWAQALGRLHTHGADRAAQVTRGRTHAATFRWAKAAGQVAEACRLVSGAGAA
jgi:glycosyltransferase involved in cell wall biosynthesis